MEKLGFVLNNSLSVESFTLSYEVTIYLKMNGLARYTDLF